MRYRSEIDGLRAVSVLAVFFFHLGDNITSGGYVGVDVFFVISGYLITSLILSERQRNEFSLVSFYARRSSALHRPSSPWCLRPSPSVILSLLPVITRFWRGPASLPWPGHQISSFSRKPAI